MAALNKVFLIGNLTRDPEVRYGGAGGAIGKFGVAVNRQWKDASGQPQEETTFVDITVFGRQAETCKDYLRKGRPVFIEGRLNFSSWEDRETHQKRSKLEVVAERVQFLGSGQGGQGRTGGGETDDVAEPRGGNGERHREAPADEAPPTEAQAPAAAGGKGGDEDNLPF